MKNIPLSFLSKARAELTDELSFSPNIKVFFFVFKSTIYAFESAIEI